MRRDSHPIGGSRGRPHAHAWLWMLCAFICAFGSPAWGQSRAWLDRERIAFDETTVLNIEVDTTKASGIPDLRALERDFRIVGSDMRQNLNLSNGDVALRVNMQLILQPLRHGEIQIPMLSIGDAVTPPLRLTVLPPREAPPSEAPQPVVAGTPLFIRVQVDSETPYVQQTLGYTVRLYYISGSLIDGRIDQDPPEGASLQKIGDDLQLSQRIGNDDYSVVERRFLLVPERSGVVTIPPARFLGRSMGLFDSGFGGREEMRIRSEQLSLRVKPIPDAAPQPWLPLRGLTLRYLETPRSLRTGESATIAVEVVADGATAAQLPALSLTSGDAQIFAEPAQSREDFVSGRPQTTVLRRFSVLPARDGTLRIAGPRVNWWDTEAGVARIASLPDLVLPVAPGVAGVAAPDGQHTDINRDTDGARSGSPQAIWRWVALPFLALLWVVALALAWRIWSVRRRRASAGAVQPVGDHRRPSRPSSGSSITASSTSLSPAAPPMDARHLPAALSRGDLGEIVRALCATAGVKAGDLDAVRARLDDPVQRDAVDTLQRARWGDGDAAVTLQILRSAFASGMKWRAVDAARAPALLPPLYPEA